MRHKKNKLDSFTTAVHNHRDVPADWYESSVQHNLLQRFWHSQRKKKVIQYSKKVKGKFLDIGSADGYFTNIILDATGADQIIGIDVLQSSVDYANRRYKYNKKLQFQTGDAHNIKFLDNSFQAIYALESLEHVSDPIKVLSEILRTLKKGGYTIILVPTENYLFKVIWFLWTKSKGKVWKDAHLHAFKNTQLPSLMKQLGFKNITYEFFLYNMLLIIRAQK